MVQWTNGPMDQWTNGPMDQWTNGPMNQWTNGLMDHCGAIQQIVIVMFFISILVMSSFAKGILNKKVQVTPHSPIEQKQHCSIHIIFWKIEAVPYVNM